MTALLLVMFALVDRSESLGASGVIRQIEGATDHRIPTFVSRKVAEQFDHFVYRRLSETGEDEIPFRLLRPDGAKGAKMPLLVWLHGAGESGDNNVSHLRWLELLMGTDGESMPPLFVLAVQCPDTGISWAGKDGAMNAPVDRITVALEIVDQMLKDMSIDRNRIYVSGVSSGGNACWEIMKRQPDLFAAAVPLASGGTRGELNHLTNIPIWAFHNVNDESLSITHVRQTVTRLKELGGMVALNETIGGPELSYHNCWTAAFRDYGVLDWLLAQRKNATEAPEPGDLPLATRWRLARQSYLNWTSLWPRLVPLAAIACIGLLIRWEILRRRRHGTYGVEKNILSSPEKRS